ncbi:MAG TPA: YARHG domain-containing protein [Pyrinomonadaceae bacterium]|nr:YARHG domain-containing protein [Pyrinomonadaceae bacterium]
MKRCPTCNSTYTNDTLRFCLQDGAALVDTDDAPYSSDQQRPVTDEDTLQISGATPSTDPLDARAAETNVTPPAPETAVARQSFRRRSTRGDEEEVPSTARAINIPLVAGITAIIVLLLVIVGIGIALLMRGGGEGRRRAANEAARNANSRGGHEPDAEALNSNNPDRPRRPDMTGEFSPAAARVEAKVLRGQSVTANDIAGLPRAELRRLRNTVYARHGRIFERMELQQYFDGRPWYKKRADYTDDDLTPIDRDNINLIRAAEDRSA